MDLPLYREFAPRRSLRDWVRCVWVFRGPASNEPQPIAPDGCCELIVHRGVPYLERAADKQLMQAPILFAGQLTQPLTLVARGAPDVIGVRLEPWAARAFLAANADLAADKRIDLSEVHGDAADALLRAVRAAPRDEGREFVEAYVETRLSTQSFDDDVRAVVQAMVVGARPLVVDDISERHWQRRFKAEVGVSPRQLQSIFRFRRVFDAIEAPERIGWVEAALAAGYFDQPQMSRDFRRFLGCTARQWATQKAGLARALTGSETYKKPAGASG